MTRDLNKKSTFFFEKLTGYFSEFSKVETISNNCFPYKSPRPQEFFCLILKEMWNIVLSSFPPRRTEHSWEEELYDLPMLQQNLLLCSLK